MSSEKGLVFDIKRDCSEDGPGIRTTVFLKGCPLSCVWCQNPEGRAVKPETDIHGTHIGTWYTVDELMYRLLQDKSIFTASGGGVTLSGGEATLQMGFASKLLQALKREGIHTAIETSGFFDYQRFKDEMLPWLDLIYYDIKLMDEAAKHTTGRRRPWQRYVYCYMYKTFYIRESMRIQFRWEAFNFFNTPWFGDPAGISFSNLNQLTPDGARNGEIRSIRTAMRIQQFGLKFTF